MLSQNYLAEPLLVPTSSQLPRSEATLSDGLDYYKPTMSQLAYERHPDAEVTFTFKNRNSDINLAEYVPVNQLQERLDNLRLRGWDEEELAFLLSIQMSDGKAAFSNDYINYLRQTPLPKVSVNFDEQSSDLAIQATGDWPTVTFWETVVMSQVNELYFENYLLAHDIDPAEVYDEGDRRLREKIAILQDNPGVKIVDFGTRRHFSFRWQKHVVDRLLGECPENILGTSNVGLARRLNIKPIGTFAHEMPMVYAALADGAGKDVYASHDEMLNDWYGYYGEDYSTALTDTFGSRFFLDDFTPEQADKWRGVRHDSGDPIKFGEDMIAFYKHQGLSPKTKTIVFSDGLDIDKIVQLYNHFNGRINVVFGWGTTLTNDLGQRPLNIVMKASSVNGVETVKLSDDEGKHTGSSAQVEKYKQIFSVED